MNYWIYDAIGIALQIGAIMLAMRIAPGSFPVLVAALVVSSSIVVAISSRVGVASSMSGFPKSTATLILASIVGLAPLAFSIYNYGWLKAIGALLVSVVIAVVGAMVF